MHYAVDASRDISRVKPLQGLSCRVRQVQKHGEESANVTSMSVVISNSIWISFSIRVNSGLRV